MLPSVQLAPAQNSNGAQQDSYVFKANAELVLTNVVVRDAKTGEFVRGLKQSDFIVLENGKPQQISSFDFQSVDMAKPLNEATISGLAAGVNGPGTKAAVVAKPEDLSNHRLIVMFFDLTSMQPEDLDRCVKAARDFLSNKMQPADLVALVSLDQTLKVDQDFTSDKAALANEVGIYNGTEGQGFAEGATANSNQVEDTTGYTPDESEYNDLNTDRELFALRAISKSLEKITEEEIAAVFLRRHLAGRHRESGVAARGCQFGGAGESLDLQRGHARTCRRFRRWEMLRREVFAGPAHSMAARCMNNMNANFASQEVMATLSSDTGGKAFFDSNDFAPAFAQVQRDTSAYYAIGFHSTNPARDGKYRNLTIKINRPGVKLEYRPGYYAPADFKHSGREDRERELEEQLASDLPATDMAVYLDAMYFRLDENRFFVPVSLIVPGSQIPFVKGGDKDKATLDIIGEVIDEVKRPIGQRARDGEAESRSISAGAAEEHPVHDELQPAAGQIPPEVCGARKPDRAHGLVRGGDHAAGYEEAAAEDEFDCAGFAAAAEQEDVAAGARRRGVCAEYQPRFPAGPAPLSALRSVWPGAARNRRTGSRRGARLESIC